MSKEQFVHHRQPNAVLRGGPLAGGRIRVERIAPYVDLVEAQRVFYRPTAEVDEEFPNLVVYAFDRAEAA
ncbi:hypothetical protein [Actinospica robiniae]|uniref:hypothetical protein n=1 Tax=Actinospica robiniae TaxID=304901 RepID=UPI0004081134|nr:hypothetical protein [Actinospica robiniae]